MTVHDQYPLIIATEAQKYTEEIYTLCRKSVTCDQPNVMIVTPKARADL